MTRFYKKAGILLIFLYFNIQIGIAQEQRVFIDAVKNSIGTSQDGKFYRVKVNENVTYSLEITGGTAIFNTNDNAEMVNMGVMYVEPPRKMTIKSINKGAKTYVVSEGNLLLFFVDDPDLNRGGFYVTIKQVNR